MVDVLVFGAHPDDAEFGMGATLCRLAQEGFSIAICVLTRGECGTFGTPVVREAEMKQAANFLGADITILDYMDCSVEDNVVLRKELAGVIRKYQPSMVFAPWYDNPDSHVSGSSHPDHLALGSAVRFATRLARFKNASSISGSAHRVSHVLYYMLGRFDRPTVCVEVTKYMQLFRELMACHASQLALKEGGVAEYLVSLRQRGEVFVEEFVSVDAVPISFSSLLRINTFK
ncbi:MAG: PIG-L family deacetylase [Candidatus Woesearchaeota archaeon]